MLLSLLLNTAIADNTAMLDAANGFKVPTMEAKQLSVQGQDLFSLSGYGNTFSDLDFHLGSTYSLLNQSPMMTYTVVNDVNLDGTSGVDDENALNMTLSESIKGEIQKYFNSERGAFVQASGDWLSIKEADIDLSNEMTVELSAGYGRIVDARTIAQAQAACESLNKECDAVKLTRIAEVIGQRNQFIVAHRFEADKYFYAAIAEEIGDLKSDEVFELRQILESPIYNIGSRRVGWFASLGTENNVTGIGGETTVVDDIPIIQKAGYATLLDSKTGLVVENKFTVSETVTDIDNVSDLNLSVSINRDHTYQWRSQVDSGIEKTLGVDGGKFYLDGESNLALGSDLVFSGVISLEKMLIENSDITWTVTSNLTYFIF